MSFLQILQTCHNVYYSRSFPTSPLHSFAERLKCNRKVSALRRTDLTVNRGELHTFKATIFLPLLSHADGLSRR